MFYKIGFIMAKLFGNKLYWVETKNSRKAKNEGIDYYLGNSNIDYYLYSRKSHALLRAQIEACRTPLAKLHPVPIVIDHYGPITKRIYREHTEYVPKVL